ncbi:hypothetical protein MRX96_016963 [Rhipicephalus microplus]
MDPDRPFRDMRAHRRLFGTQRHGLNGNNVHRWLKTPRVTSRKSSSYPRLDFWDSVASRKLKNVGTPSVYCLQQVRPAVLDIYVLPVPRIVIIPDEKNVSRIHGLLLGPAGTPYEGGFFRFVQKCMPTRLLVKLLTTDDGQVRFAPYLNEEA